MEEVHPRDFVAAAGARLKELRRDRRISRRQLAQHAQLHPSVVYRAEEGRDAKLSTWYGLFSALGYDLRLETAEACDEYADWLREEGERRRARRDEALCTGKRRF